MYPFTAEKRSICLATLWLFLIASVGHAKIDQAIADAARAEVDAAVQTIGDLAGIESPSSSAEGLAQVADILDERLQALDFATRRETSPADVNADTVIGVRKGNGSQKVMLIAHMDTVFDVGTLEHSPVRLDGDKLYGPAVVDNKGGIGIILHSLQVLNDLDWADYDTLTVMFNPDEETGSAGSGALIAELGSEMDTVLSFEIGGSPKRGWGWIILGAAGYVEVTMTVNGLAAHAAEAEKGRNAVLELANQVLATRNVHKSIVGADMNWTIVGNDNAINRIPELATATADVRITVEGAEVALLEALQAKIKESILIPNTETTVSMRLINPIYRAGKRGYEVSKLIQEIHAEVSPLTLYLVPMVKGVSHMGYASKDDHIAVIEGLGPSGEGVHARLEYLDIPSIMPAIYRTVRLLMELENQAKQ